MIDIEGKDKADVLAKLYNASRPLGLGIVQAVGDDMTLEEARRVLDSDGTYVDYLNGRVMKVDLSGSVLDPRLYDRDNGQGAADRAINAINWVDTAPIGEEVTKDAETIAGEAYQIIGSLAEEAGLFNHPSVQRALDYFVNIADGEARAHVEILPWDVLE